MFFSPGMLATCCRTRRQREPQRRHRSLGRGPGAGLAGRAGHGAGLVRLHCGEALPQEAAEQGGPGCEERVLGVRAGSNEDFGGL